MGEARRREKARALSEKRARESCAAPPMKQCKRWQHPGWCRFPYVPVPPPKPIAPVEREAVEPRQTRPRMLMGTAAILAVIASTIPAETKEPR